MGSTGATNATADAKRAYARLLDVFEDRTESCCLYHPAECRCAEDARVALLRAADALIEALRDIEALPTHGRPRRYTEMASDALARVAAMGKADRT